MLLAMEFARVGKQVLYVDGSLSFSPSLILEWSKKKHETNIGYLSKIELIKIFEYESLMELLQEFHHDTSNHGCVLIIDELTSIVLANNLYDPEDERRSRDKCEALFDNIYYTLGDISNRFNVLTFAVRIEGEKIAKKLRLELSE